jgi:hypothetical protein
MFFVDSEVDNDRRFQVMMIGCQRNWIAYRLRGLQSNVFIVDMLSDVAERKLPALSWLRISSFVKNPIKGRMTSSILRL